MMQLERLHTGTDLKQLVLRHRHVMILHTVTDSLHRVLRQGKNVYVSVNVMLHTVTLYSDTLTAVCMNCLLLSLKKLRSLQAVPKQW